MVTGDILYLTIHTLFDVVVKKNFPLLPIGWYLFRVVSGNSYLLNVKKGDNIVNNMIKNMIKDMVNYKSGYNVLTK